MTVQKFSELACNRIYFSLNLIAAIKNGDTLVFEQLYNLQHEKLYFFVLKKTNSTYLAEEVVQLAFIKFWNNRHSLKEDLPAEAQLFQVAKTSLIDLLRKRANQRQLLQHYADVIPIENENVMASLLKKEAGERISHMIEKLPPVRKKIFKLSRENGLTHKEIAEQLSLTTKNVENHIAKAIKQLRRALTALCSFTLLYILITCLNKYF